MLVIDASIIVRTLGHNPDYWRVAWVPQLQNLVVRVGVLPLFISFYFVLWLRILVGITPPRAVVLLLSELRAASEKVQWRRDCPRFSWLHSATVPQKKKKKNYKTARSVNRHCLKLTDNAISAYIHLFSRLCILAVLVKTWRP